MLAVLVVVSFTRFAPVPWSPLKLKIEKRRLLTGCDGQQRYGIPKAETRNGP